MEQTLVSRSLSEFLGTIGAGLLARNSGTTEFNQAATHLAHRVLAGIPRPVESRQGDGHNTRSQELEQQVGDTQKQRPAAHALSRAPLIVAQAQFFKLIEVDL